MLSDVDFVLELLLMLLLSVHVLLLKHVLHALVLLLVPHGVLLADFLNLLHVLTKLLALLFPSILSFFISVP